MPENKNKSQNNDQKIGSLSVAVIIVAAGRGHRAGAEIPKQYNNIIGKPVLYHTITSFSSCITINDILCIIHPDDRALYDNAVEGFELLEPVLGGTTRQESVYNGLLALSHKAPDIILIHDAARPFVSASLINELVTCIASGEKAALPALEIVDTVKTIKDGYVTGTTDRANLCRAQTPQAFDYNAIFDAHQKAKGMQLTDDVAVAEAAGMSIKVIAGEETAFKITQSDDFKKAEEHLMMQMGDIRVGQGYDVHKFEAGDHVMLCGVKVPHDKALKGHSDADVAMHALTDALYGAMGEGDIGRHFPPSEPKWKGAPSHIFLKHAADMLSSKGGMVSNIDITIICEVPKITPHNEKMRKKLAEIMNITLSRVSVKATTTEKLGFTGRGEGIAADATATIRMPTQSSMEDYNE